VRKDLKLKINLLIFLLMFGSKINNSWLDNSKTKFKTF